jgi:hypothetical protein
MRVSRIHHAAWCECGCSALVRCSGAVGTTEAAHPQSSLLPSTSKPRWQSSAGAGGRGAVKLGCTYLHRSCNPWSSHTESGAVARGIPSRAAAQHPPASGLPRLRELYEALWFLRPYLERESHQQVPYTSSHMPGRSWGPQESQLGRSGARQTGAPVGLERLVHLPASWQLQQGRPAHPPAHRPGVHPDAVTFLSRPLPSMWVEGGMSWGPDSRLVQGRLSGWVQSSPVQPAARHQSGTNDGAGPAEAGALQQGRTMVGLHLHSSLASHPPAGHSHRPLSWLQLPTPLQSLGHGLSPRGTGLKGCQGSE